MSVPASTRKWATKCASTFHIVLSSIVFLFLDCLETVLCLLFRYLDDYFEGKPSCCYCENTREVEDDEVSETLCGRRNVFREIGFLQFARKWDECRSKKVDGLVTNRWSDCGCESCVSWMKNGDQKLHVVVNEPSHASIQDSTENPTENVIFLHGFLSSSSIWKETAFKNQSQKVKDSYRLFAVDLLGFGRSPKPRDTLYTLRDHLNMIEKSVICPFDLKSFHLVAHSMGCIIALAVAAKYAKFVKSVTLVAPPVLLLSEAVASFTVLNRLAMRRLWPLLLFGSSVMSWYEHLGRCVCFLFCRNHRIWESIVKLLTGKRDLPFLITDLTKHTHHSAWHCMHNVICGGAKYIDDYLKILIANRVKVCVIQGEKDQVVPVECSFNIKMKVTDAEVNIIPNADHNTVIFGREKEFTERLEEIWALSADINSVAE
ncbi:probable lysophospholipase BODYGUARD 4 [Mangifera indica]|uniref:probable lysophospholipase BODYGUARD 4 n=1 Tax=Mangifera indica TaxID=29780 RepID=UPI001CFABC5F|nr:probable lysophospholipase BODYGUARD 4 [Mangifera indica]